MASFARTGQARAASLRRERRQQVDGTEPDTGWQVTMHNMRTFAVMAIVTGLALGLGGCREEEQNRPLHLEKGTYSGKTDTELTEEQRRTLRERGRHQAF